MQGCNDIVGNEGHPALREFRGIVSNMCGGLIGNAGYKLRRYIATLDAATMFIRVATPISAVATDYAQLNIATAQSGVIRDWGGGFMQFDAGDLLQLTNCTMTVDGTPIASGASIAAYLDDVNHAWVPTFTGPVTIDYLGQSGAGTNYAGGELFTPAATGITTHHPISNDSLVYQQATGSGLGVDTVADGGFDLPASFGSPSTAWTFIADIGDIDTTVTSKLHVTAGTSGDVWNKGGAVGDYTKTHVLTFTISDSTANAGVVARLYNATGTVLVNLAGTTYFTADGTYVIVVPANTVVQNFVIGFFRLAGHTGTLNVDNASFQEAPNALLFNNFTTATWGDIYTRQGTCWVRTANTICDA